MPVKDYRACLLKFSRGKGFGKYTTVFRLQKQLNNFLHTQFTTCIRVGKVMNVVTPIYPLLSASVKELFH